MEALRILTSRNTRIDELGRPLAESPVSVIATITETGRAVDCKRSAPVTRGRNSLYVRCHRGTKNGRRKREEFIIYAVYDNEPDDESP